MTPQSILRSRRGTGVLLAVAAVTVALGGCGSASPSGTGPAPSSSVTSDGSPPAGGGSTTPVPVSPSPTGGTVPGGTPSGSGPGHCTAGQLRYLAIGTNGAAGTVVSAVRVTNVGTDACWTYGYPGLQILTATGRAVPTTTIRAGEGMPASLATKPQRITLPPGSWAWFAISYHTTAAPPCTSEPVEGARLAVIAPDTSEARTVRLDTSAACGRLGTSAILAASSWRADEWARP